MKISVILEALTANFETDMKRAEKATANFKKEALRSANEINQKLGDALTIGITAAVAGVAVAVKSAVDEMDNIGKAAQKVGVTTEALSALNYAAKLSDVSFGQLTGAMARLSKQQSEIAQGNEKTAELFRQLGVEARNADGSLRDTGEVMIELADVFASMEDGADKTALAIALFGKSGKELIPLLNSGSAGLREMTEEARTLGVVVSEESAQAAERFNDNLTRMGASVEGATFKLAEQLLPTLEDISQQVVDMATDPAFQQDLANAIRTIGEIAIGTATGIMNMVNAMGYLYDEARALIGIVDSDDLERLIEQRDAIDLKMKGWGDLPGGGRNRMLEQLQAERAEIQKQIDLLEHRARLAASGLEEVSVTGRRRTMAPQINYGRLGAAARAPSASAPSARPPESPDYAGEFWDAVSRETEAADKARTEALDTWAQDRQSFWDSFEREDRERAAAFNSRTEEMSEFAVQAARNMQTAFADFLFDPFEGGMRGMLSSFVDILRRMAAEAIAAQIFEGIGSWGQANAGGGGLMGGIAGFFGAFAGAKDAGGSIPSGSWALVGERRPEIVAGPATVIGGARTAAMMQPAGGGGKGTTIVNAIDPRFIAEYLAGPAGDEVYLNMVGRNARRTRSIVGA